MIGSLARRMLDAGLDLSPEDVADVLWLVAAQGTTAGRDAGGLQRPPDPARPDPPPPQPVEQPPGTPEPRGDGSPTAPLRLPTAMTPLREPGMAGVPVAVPGAPHLSRSLHILRALRPFRRVHVAGPDLRVDIDATVQATADARRLDPASLVVISRPRRRRKLEAVLVVDAAPSMSIWNDTAREMAQLLEQLGSFRAVSRWVMTTEGTVPTAPCVVRPVQSRATQPAARVVDQSGNRVIFVLTDAVDAAWYYHARWRAIRLWARTNPTVIVQVLPRRYWAASGIGDLPVTVRAPWPACSNRLLHTTRMWWSTADVDQGDDAPLPVPVISLTDEALQTWADATLTGIGWVDATLTLPPPSGPARQVADPPLSAEERVRAFDARASKGAYRLARLLSVAPVLNLPLIRVIQARLVPGTGVPELAEIFVAGLLEEIGPASSEHDRRLRFRPDVAPILQRGSNALEEWEMYAAVSEYLTRTRPPRRGLRAMAAVVGAEAALDAEERPFGEMLHRLGQRLGMEGELAADDGRGRDDGLPAVGDPQRWRSRPDATASADAGHPAANRRRRGLSGSDAGPALSGERQPAVWGYVPPRNPRFTGREDLLAELRTRLRAEPATSVVVLHGVGGAGKSQVAAEFVHRNQPDYDVIWWIPAERTAQIRNALTDLGEHLGLTLEAEANVAVREVVRALRDGVPYARWLLVFDNADDPVGLREYLPVGRFGHVLVTSRTPRESGAARSLELPVFQRQESIELLRREGRLPTDEDADVVADALGDLPLAVELAAMWFAETDMSPAEYVRLLAERNATGAGGPSVDERLPAAAAWEVSLERLAESSPTALELLQLCAFLAPEPISLSLLARGSPDAISPALDEALRDPDQLVQAAREIVRYALARIGISSESIVIHRLVQGMVVGRMAPTSRNATRRAAHLLLAANDPDDPERPGAWPDYAALYPHVIASGAIDSVDQQVRRLLLNVVDYLFRWGDHEAAAALAESAYQAWLGRFADEDPITLEMASTLGWSLVMIGRYREAEEINVRTLAVCIRARGATAKPTLTAYGNVAADRRVAGDFVGALDVAMQAYEGALTTVGPDDPVTLSAAHNVGVALRLLGRFGEARDLDEDTWQRRCRLFGQNDERSLNTLSGLIIDRRELGDYLGARAAQEDAFERCRQVFSEARNHPARLRAAQNLAIAHRRAGNHKRALRLSQEAERGFFLRYGVGHPEGISAALTVSIDLRHSGRLEDARRIGKRTYERSRQRLGADHPHTLAASLNLATIDRRLQRLQAAIDRDAGDFRAFDRRLGAKHPSTLACTANLASDLFTLGRLDEARHHDRTALAGFGEVFGRTHPSALAVAGNLAVVLRALNRADEAVHLRATTLTELVAGLYREHPLVRALASWNRVDFDVDPVRL